MTAVVCTYPLDLVRATMATPAGAHHTSMREALVSCRLPSELLGHHLCNVPPKIASQATRLLCMLCEGSVVATEEVISILAERLDLETLAEGVETAGEHALLSQLGCGHVQGFGIGRPMPFDQTLDWITAHEAKLQDAPEIGRQGS